MSGASGQLSVLFAFLLLVRLNFKKTYIDLKRLDLNMISITRRLEFDAGHRVMNHESKCATLHGHRYVVEAFAVAPELDSLGRVIDFSVLKEKLGTWLDEQWDHNMIIFHEDKEVLAALGVLPRKKDPWIAPFNPTAENMASYLLNDVCPDLFANTQIKIIKIRIHETPNCYAEASL